MNSKVKSILEGKDVYETLQCPLSEGSNHVLARLSVSDKKRLDALYATYYIKNRGKWLKGAKKIISKYTDNPKVIDVTLQYYTGENS